MTRIASILAALLLAATAQAGLAPALWDSSNGGGNFLSWWTFDDSACRDMIGGANGTPVNGATPVAGKFGNALWFNKTNYIQMNAHAAELNIAAPASLSMWVYPTNAANVGLGGWGQALFQARNDAGTHILGFGYGNGTATIGGESFYVAAANPSSASLQAATDNTYTNYVNRWSHVILVAGGFGDWRIYINGVRQALTTWPNGTNQVGYWSKNMSTTEIDRVTIGMAINDPGNAFQGYIDDFRLYNRALTDDEVYSISGGF